MSNDPSATSPAVDRMRGHWSVVAPLMGGTKAMRDAGQKLLPRFPAEELDTYTQRLALSTLLPAYAETVANNAARVFAEPLQLGEDVPPVIAELCEDIDRSGNNLSAWAVELFQIGLSHGLCHALVDYPKTEGFRTKADEEAAGLRPYAVLIKPEQIRGWQQKEGKLTQVRYLESVSVDVGEFGSETVEQIRVLEPGLWYTYRRIENAGAWALHDIGETSLKHIPWLTFYARRTDFMEAKPPLLELAHLNVKHWQSQSDQDNLLHVARVPLLFVFTDDEQFKLTISAGSATRMPKDGSAGYVEHTGAAISAGRQSLLDLVDDMRLAGAKLLQRDKQATKTAAQANEEAAQELSPLARMASHFGDCIALLLQHIADYKGLPKGGKVEMRGNFESDYAPEVSLPVLVAMATAGQISDESLFSEMQRRGVLSDELSWEQERERMDGQGPALGGM